MVRRAILIPMALLIAAPAFAQAADVAPAPLGYDPPSPEAIAARNAGVVALSAQAREDALETAASRGNSGLGEGSKRAIHGEVGMMMGSHGTRALWGTAAVPLGDTGQAVVSVMTGRDNLPYYRR